MPTYDYRCQDCHRKFAATHSMFEAPILECPRCHGVKTKRLITSFPHTRLAWRAWDRNDTGSSKLTIRSAKAGKTSDKDGWAGKEYLDERKRAKERQE